MRRAMGLVVAAVLPAAALLVAVLVPAPGPLAPDAPHITRLFMPAIKADCRTRAEVPVEVRIGYTFRRTGALVTIDRTGEFTGLRPETLAALNACLALYPIDPIERLPRDHYRRNVLYDYYTGVLAPCLAGRVDDMPPIPSRADFVVRLYQWEPYQSIVPGRPLDELLELATDCPALPSYLAAD